MSTVTLPDDVSPSGNKRSKTDDERVVINREDEADNDYPGDPEKSPESGLPEENQEVEEEEEEEIDLCDDDSEYDFEMPSDVEDDSTVIVTPVDRIQTHDPDSDKKPKASGFDKLALAKKRYIFEKSYT